MKKFITSTSILTLAITKLYLRFLPLRMITKEIVARAEIILITPSAVKKELKDGKMLLLIIDSE